MNALLKTGVALIAPMLATPALSCSICRCGDPTFNALGKDGVALTGLRLALDWDQVKKTQGDHADSLQERRTTLLMAYGISDRFGIFARLPYSERDLTESEDRGPERTRVTGLADPELYAQMRLWSSGFDGAVGIRAALFAIAGVKTAWGQDNVSRGGQRLDEHVQPGTGSSDWFGGLAGSYQLNPRSALFVSAQYRQTGSNDFGYRYGRIALLNLALEHKMSARWDVALEGNYRHAGRDEIDASGLTDPDTGGSITYLTPRILFDAGRGWVLRASGQIPLSQAGLNGSQREKTVFNVGLTRLFRK